MSARLAVASQLVCALLLLSGPSHPTAAAEPAPLPEAPARDKPAPAAPTQARDIRQRFVPPVAGLDLEQALNYTDSDGL
ncbi:MAG: hypothetical protein MUC88_28485, partial [Planctomycetes bacterium]|nr:hypothetical protein [Planctomycetota bacterium]